MIGQFVLLCVVGRNKVIDWMTGNWDHAYGDRFHIEKLIPHSMEETNSSSVFGSMWWTHPTIQEKSSRLCARNLLIFTSKSLKNGFSTIPHWIDSTWLHVTCFLVDFWCQCQNDVMEDLSWLNFFWHRVCNTGFRKREIAFSGLLFGRGEQFHGVIDLKKFWDSHSVRKNQPMRSTNYPHAPLKPARTDNPPAFHRILTNLFALRLCG